MWKIYHIYQGCRYFWPWLYETIQLNLLQLWSVTVTCIKLYEWYSKHMVGFSIWDTFCCKAMQICNKNIVVWPKRVLKPWCAYNWAHFRFLHVFSTVRYKYNINRFLQWCKMCRAKHDSNYRLQSTVVLVCLHASELESLLTSSGKPLNCSSLLIKR